MPEQINDPRALSVLIAELLSKGSLYRRFAYIGRGCHFEKLAGLDGMTPFRYGRVPSLMKMQCTSQYCKQETIWEVSDREDVYFKRDEIHHRAYTCRNCRSNIVNYWFTWEEHKDDNEFMKVGQWPPLAIEPTPALADSLGKEESELYKKALINANFSYGIGALAYFRRVIENKVNNLIDLIADAARNAQFELEQVARIEEVKTNRHLDTRIEFAAKILSTHLRPGGHNPLDKLYAVASAGLHGESDEECLRIFEEARFVFEYLFKNLTLTNEDAREYVKRLSSPSGT